MERVEDPASLLTWLADRPDEEAVTGYDAAGWKSSTWVIHAMYVNADLKGLGTHDELHRRLDAGDVAPLLIGDVDLDRQTTVTGTPLGFVVRPGSPWRRVLWSDYLAGAPRANLSVQPTSQSAAPMRARMSSGRTDLAQRPCLCHRGGDGLCCWSLLVVAGRAVVWEVSSWSARSR